MYNTSIDIGLFIIRLSCAIVFIKFGSEKLFAGKERWLWLGNNAMPNIGIYFFPIFWGICAMLSELIGGICLLLGIYTNIAIFFLCITMSLATLYHIKAGDSWQHISVPLSYFLIFLGLMFTGPGNYTITAFLK